MFIYNSQSDVISNSNSNSSSNRSRSNERYDFRRDRKVTEQHQTGERRTRSRSRDSLIHKRNSHPMRVYASHLTPEQIVEIEKQHEAVAMEKQHEVVVDQQQNNNTLQKLHNYFREQQQPTVVQQNPDVIIARLVQDNHSLFNAIQQRDITIRQLQDSIRQLNDSIVQLNNEVQYLRSMNIRR